MELVDWYLRVNTARPGQNETDSEKTGAGLMTGKILPVLAPGTLTLKCETHRANRWPSKAFGENRASVCSAALGAFGTVYITSAPIQLA